MPNVCIVWFSEGNQQGNMVVDEGAHLCDEHGGKEAVGDCKE